MTAANTTHTELATFGAGCFWSTEQCFRKQFETNLVSAAVGYMVDTSLLSGEEACNGTKNYVEALQISFDRRSVTYNNFVRFFYGMHDPTVLSKSGNYQTTQYRSVIFTHTTEQQKIAEQIRDELQITGEITGQIITQIQPVDRFQFRIAEQKHQNYLNNKYGWLMRSS